MCWIHRRYTALIIKSSEILRSQDLFKCFNPITEIKQTEIQGLSIKSRQYYSLFNIYNCGANQCSGKDCRLIKQQQFAAIDSRIWYKLLEELVRTIWYFYFSRRINIKNIQISFDYCQLGTCNPKRTLQRVKRFEEYVLKIEKQLIISL